MAPPSSVREMAATVRVADGALFAIGGASPEVVSLGGEDDLPMFTMRMNTLRSVEAFADGVWRPMPSLLEPRCCCGAAVDSVGDIYVVGGGTSMYRGAACLRSVERFDWDAARWESAPMLREARNGVGVAISHATERLFAFGGYGGDHDYLDTCESMPVGSAVGADARWTELPCMSCKRAGPCAAAGPDGRLYVLGGGPDGTDCWASMEALDPRTSSWDTSLAQANTARHYNAAAFGPDGKLYVSGAFRHAGQLDVVERYDPVADKWEKLSGIGFVVKFSSGVFTF